jgi:hypothetical protein
MAKSLTQEFVKGLWQEIPPFRLVLGLCPALGVTTTHGKRHRHGVGHHLRAALLQYPRLAAAQGDTRQGAHRLFHHHHRHLRDAGGAAHAGPSPMPCLPERWACSSPLSWSTASCWAAPRRSPSKTTIIMSHVADGLGIGIGFTLVPGRWAACGRFWVPAPSPVWGATLCSTSPTTFPLPAVRHSWYRRRARSSVSGLMLCGMNLLGSK